MANIVNHVLKNGVTIGKAKVVSNKLLKKGSCIPGTKIVPTSVTFHQTDCINVDAPTMHRALTNANNDRYAGTDKSNYKQASWTITVGDDEIIQNVPLNWKAYAQGCTSGNNTSISVEICMYTDKYKQHKAYLNAIALFKLLKKEYNKKLVPKSHYDWTKKNCPSWLRANKYGYSWSWFKKELTSSSQVPPTSSTSDFKVRVKVSALNIRSGAGTSYKVTGCIRDKGTYTIVSTKGNWGKLKSGAGWICIDKEYVQRI